MKRFIPNTLGLTVDTPDGQKPFAGIAFMGDRPTFRIDFTNRKSLTTTAHHRLICPDGPTEVIDLRTGQEVFTKNGRKTKIAKVEATGEIEAVYDLVGVGERSEYLTNGVVSHNCEFISDDETLINPLTLARLKGIEPDFYTNTVRWYKLPEANRSYLVALDPSLGTGRDYSAIQIFELPGLRQVGEWQHNLSAPRHQVRILLQIHLFIQGRLAAEPGQNGAPDIFWTVENNSIGEAILQIIEDTGEDRFPGLMISEKKRKGQTRRFRKGLNTDPKKKLSACARLKSLVESDRMIVYSKNLIKEFKNFVASESSFKAKQGEHDDLVMSLLLIVRMIEQVANWSENGNDMGEGITDDDLYGDAMPVVI